MIELAPVDEAMRQINLGLAYVSDYNAILDGALSQMVRSLGASDAAVLRYEPEFRSLRQICIIRECEPAVSQPDHPLTDSSRSMAVDAMPLWDRLRPGEVYVSHPNADQADPCLPDAIEEWHRLRKHILCLRSPLTIGSERVGWIGVSFSRDVPEIAPLLETFRVLSQQITLVLLLLQLSETHASQLPKNATESLATCTTRLLTVLPVYFCNSKQQKSSSISDLMLQKNVSTKQQPPPERGYNSHVRL